MALDACGEEAVVATGAGPAADGCEGGAVVVRGQFFKYWNRVRSGFWFLPAVMAGVAVALAS
jgi:uncharacterized membrane protein